MQKVLDGSESQYSGMQIGTLQDEEDEGAAPSSQEEPPEPFLQSALGMLVHTHKPKKPHWFSLKTGSVYKLKLCLLFLCAFPCSSEQTSSLWWPRSQPAGFRRQCGPLLNKGRTCWTRTWQQGKDTATQKHPCQVFTPEGEESKMMCLSLTLNCLLLSHHG